MPIPSSAEDRPPEDLTARARIRDAALDQFAARGVKAATLKDIADAAGVSVGLVQHHFGSKDGLREACDKHVRDVVLGGAGQVQEGADVRPGRRSSRRAKRRYANAPS
jgi:AcrR family transcriptional regulator